MGVLLVMGWSALSVPFLPGVRVSTCSWDKRSSLSAGKAWRPGGPGVDRPYRVCVSTPGFMDGFLCACGGSSSQGLTRGDPCVCVLQMFALMPCSCPATARPKSEGACQRDWSGLLRFMWRVISTLRWVAKIGHTHVQRH